jgi:hypothetical protein
VRGVVVVTGGGVEEIDFTHIPPEHVKSTSQSLHSGYPHALFNCPCSVQIMAPLAPALHLNPMAHCSSIEPVVPVVRAVVVVPVVPVVRAVVVVPVVPVDWRVVVAVVVVVTWAAEVACPYVVVAFA